MEFKSYINKILKNAASYFTVILLAYTVIVAILNADAEEILIDAQRVILFFIFSLIFSFANGVLSIKTMSTVLKFFVHYILSMLACYFCLLLPIAPTPAGAVVGIAFFSLIYFAALAVILLIKAISRKRKERKEGYKNLYNK